MNQTVVYQPALPSYISSAGSFATSASRNNNSHNQGATGAPRSGCHINTSTGNTVIRAVPIVGHTPPQGGTTNSNANNNNDTVSSRSALVGKRPPKEAIPLSVATVSESTLGSKPPEKPPKPQTPRHTTNASISPSTATTNNKQANAAGNPANPYPEQTPAAARIKPISSDPRIRLIETYKFTAGTSRATVESFYRTNLAAWQQPGTNIRTFTFEDDRVHSYSEYENFDAFVVSCNTIAATGTLQNVFGLLLQSEARTLMVLGDVDKRDPRLPDSFRQMLDIANGGPNHIGFVTK